MLVTVSFRALPATTQGSHSHWHAHFQINRLCCWRTAASWLQAREHCALAVNNCIGVQLQPNHGLGHKTPLRWANLPTPSINDGHASSCAKHMHEQHGSAGLVSFKPDQVLACLLFPNTSIREVWCVKH